MPDQPPLIFYTKPGCHLCEEGHPVVETVARRFGLAVLVVDILGDEELVARHGERIPVVTFGGEELSFGRVSAKRLERDLERRLRRSPGG